MKPDFSLSRPALSALRRPAASAAAGLLCALLPAALAAQPGSTGLSSVRSTTSGNTLVGFLFPQAGDRFAWAMVTGDFNFDGVADLATGIPFDNGEAGLEVADVGAVHVRYGSAGVGLAGSPEALFQGDAGYPDEEHVGDLFGAALAVGDFDDNGIDDLAVGIPYNYLAPSQWGAVAIHLGSNTSIAPVASEFIERGSDGVPGNEAYPDYVHMRSGAALAAGDFNGDGRDDLAVGGPDSYRIESEGGALIANGGLVLILPGRSGHEGLLPYIGYELHQDSPDVIGGFEADDRFGDTLAAGNFDGDEFDDLAVGVTGENGTGAVHIFYGAAGGLANVRSAIYFQSDFGGFSEAGDGFGEALAIGDFDNDGYDDVAVGAPYEDEGSPPFDNVDMGDLHVLYGSGKGIDPDRTDRFRQSDILDNPLADQSGDRFGAALAAGDFDGDGYDDLGIAHPGENAPGSNSGQATVLSGKAGGFLGRHDQFAPGVVGVAGVAQADQDFGFALAAGDFDGDGHHDLAVGAPYRDEPGLADVGYEVILFGSLFSDGFESAAPDAWTATEPPAP